MTLEDAGYSGKPRAGEAVSGVEGGHQQGVRTNKIDAILPPHLFLSLMSHLYSNVSFQIGRNNRSVWGLGIPSDLQIHNQYIPPENLQSQDWLNKIDEWTMKKKMLINEKKTKNMIFNFSSNYQFNTRMQLKGENIETIKNTKLLGTIISDDLKWDLNTANIVKKANARLELLRRVASFNPPLEDLKTIYILFIRSLLEQSATVWHSSLTEENISDIERVQKSAVRIMLGSEYKGYKNHLISFK